MYFSCLVCPLSVLPAVSCPTIRIVCAGELQRSARVKPRLGTGRVRPLRNREKPHCPASEKVAGVERLNRQVEERARCSEP